jgi:GWxTD domain-containing protein
LEDLTVYSRHKKSDVVPVLRAIDISALPTGKYSLGIAILSKEMNFVANKSCELERVNDSEFAFDDASILIDPAFQASIAEDSVLFYIASLIPIAGQTEIKSILKIIKAKDKELARKRIQGFWIATSGTNSYEAWSRYKAQVLLVEKLYNNNFQNGYETDRGRVYLKYGPPTPVLQKDVSSNEYPYEIWQYNKIGKTSNKRFVFYNPDLVNNTYRLLHSDMIGEIKNPSWQLILNKRNTTNGDIDDPNKNVQQIWGGNSMNNF